IQRISSWLHTCNKEHGYHCRSKPRVNQSLKDVPAWLIDVATRKIKKATPEDEYVALSYVWEPPSLHGSPNMLTIESLKSYQMPGSLKEEGIPPTVTDAISLTEKLGLQYLWVDRFCIVQDDYNTKDHQIQNMASVYANAYLTIVAGVGNASGPLEGVPDAGARQVQRRPNSRVKLLNESVWGTRAWTLQELLFSRRAVFFLEQHISWECHCDVWEESEPLYPLSDPLPCVNRFMGTSTGLQQSAWPDMEEYSRIVTNYSVRNLTYEEDTLPAFLGVTTVLSESFVEGFVYGLPAQFLDIALLWRPKSRHRRKISKGNILPSWSWMGWSFRVTEVDLSLWKAAASYVQSSKHHRRGDERRRFRNENSTTTIRPTVTWFIGPSEKRRKIENAGLQYQSLQDDPDAVLPEGWHRYPTGFQHDCDNHTLFNYPVPIRDRQNTPVLNYIPHGQHLYFITTHGFFSISFYCWNNPKRPRDEDIATGNIWDDKGRWAGHFRSHDAELSLHSTPDRGGEKLEFIAISARSERGESHVFHMRFFRLPMKVDGVVEYTNVLWIEWIDGVAYRRGVGHILTSAWEAQATEKIEVVLG
ncbi:heterokaryon incompatibility protein-domain-containing protein, partial [Massariosphaeria phaeospora]